MPPNTKPESKWDSIKKLTVGVTGVLLVVPALIHAGIDIYKSYRNIPRSDSEKANIELNAKYVGKPPAAQHPLQIKRDGIIYEAKFSIFDEGDIYVEYGKFTQWFPFPNASTIDTVSLSPISSAFAQDQDFSKIYGPYRQQDTPNGYFILRQRWYTNGAVENQTIDMRTGQIVNYSVSPPLTNVLPQQQSNDISPFAGIDLDKPKQGQQSSSTAAATNCYIPNGSCIMVQQIPRGTPCYCVTPYGPVSGMSN